MRRKHSGSSLCFLLPKRNNLAEAPENNTNQPIKRELVNNTIIVGVLWQPLFLLKIGMTLDYGATHNTYTGSKPKRDNWIVVAKHSFAQPILPAFDARVLCTLLVHQSITPKDC